MKNFIENEMEMTDEDIEWYKQLFLTRKETPEIENDEFYKSKSILQMVHEMMEIDESETLEEHEKNEKIEKIIK